MKGSTPRSAIEMSVDDLLSTDKSFLRKAWIKHVYFLSNLVNSRISDEPDPVSAERESIPSLGEFARRTKRIESGATKAKSEKIGRIDQSTAVKLAQAFIEFCIEDGDTSSQDLTKSLAAIIENVVSSRRLGEELLKDNPEQAKELNKHLEISLEHMVQVMMTLQFFDRISQRMSNAVSCLQALYTAENGSARKSADGTVSLEDIYLALGMEDARVLFKAIEAGESIPQAVKKANKQLRQVLSQDIELFDFKDLQKTQK